MKDFQRRKMAMRIALAKEMARRGLPYEEIEKACRPSAKDFALLKAEIDAEAEEDIINAEWVKDIDPIKPRQSSQLLYWVTLCGLFASTAISLWIVLQLFGI